MRALLLSIIALGATASLNAAPLPMTAKDVALLVRTGTPEAEIFAEIEKRRLLSPIDAPFLKVLEESAVTSAFVAKLKAGDYSLSSAAAAGAKKRIGALKQEAEEDAARTATMKAEAMRKSPQPGPLNITQLIGNRLVKLEGSTLRDVDAASLGDIRIFAFYNSAGWCAPCRKFTPRLVDAYRKIKAKHPEFEIVFISGDRDAFNMQNYMQTAQMPWPAVKFASKDSSLAPLGSNSIPYLKVVDAEGRDVVKATDPGRTLSADQVLDALMKAFL